jgi:hypothetical protein
MSSWPPSEPDHPLGADDIGDPLAVRKATLSDVLVRVEPDCSSKMCGLYLKLSRFFFRGSKLRRKLMRQIRGPGASSFAISAACCNNATMARPESSANWRPVDPWTPAQTGRLKLTRFRGHPFV